MNILGLMSGTSLDGLDLALCRLQRHADGGIGHRILAATTLPYPDAWRSRLASLEQATAFDYALADTELGHYMGRAARAFLERQEAACDAVASHGHTIFHRPDLGLTTQIGLPDAIAAETGLPVVGGFRTLDVALGGQGAPLVPIGDRLLFPQYEACLNLGGFANISFDDAQGRRVAFDIGPCNMLLNRLAQRLGLDYDPCGRHASEGRTIGPLLQACDALPYYAQPAPKSLGKEWFVAQLWPLFEASEAPTADLLRTATEHIARQLAAVLNTHGTASLLVSGGGAFNTFLLDRLRALTPCRIHIPDAQTVNYKEALIFALLGFLRLEGRVNTLATVTGARADSSGGSVTGHAATHNKSSIGL